MRKIIVLSHRLPGLLFLSISLSFLPQAFGKETVALMELQKGRGVPDALADSLSDQWMKTVEQHPNLASLAPNVVQQLLKLKKVSMSDDCMEASCLAPAGQALDVSFVIAIRLEKEKDAFRFRGLIAESGPGTERARFDEEITEETLSKVCQQVLDQTFPSQGEAPEPQDVDQAPALLDSDSVIQDRKAKTPEGMVYLPGALFPMGSKTGELDEKPVNLIKLSGFYIDIQEVSSRDYQRFVKEAGYRKPEWKDERLSAPDMPIVGISWDDASAYAKWAGKRLPTEAEWEYAARGLEGRLYPWGDAPPVEEGAVRCNLWGNQDGHEMVAPVGSFPLGISASGCMDLAGNTWEWVSSLYRPYPYDPTDGREDPGAQGDRVVRGGCWVHNDPYLLRSSARNAFPSASKGLDFLYVGFRCAKTPE